MVTLKEIIKKSYKKHTYDLVMRYIGRPLSYFVLWLLHPVGVTANQISLASIILFLVPFFLISSGSRNLAIIGSLFLLFNIVLDCADGGMARLRKDKTLNGKYLEWLFHEICVPLLFFALSIYSFKYFDNPYILILGTITVFSICLTNIVRLDKYRIILEHSFKKNKLPAKMHEVFLVHPKSRNSIKKIVFHIIVVFNSIGHLFFIIFLLSLFGLLQYAIIFYSIFYFSIAIIKLFVEIKVGFKDYGFK